jgi:flagellar hook-basal body complex protein FliE
MIDAISSISSAISGPGAVTGTQFTEGLSQPRVSSVPGADFARVFADLSSDAISTMKNGEAMAISGIQGKASVQSVVQAVLSAEQTLQSALAVRDKVVAAYQEISRMAI